MKEKDDGSSLAIGRTGSKAGQVSERPARGRREGVPRTNERMSRLPASRPVPAASPLASKV